MDLGLAGKAYVVTGASRGLGLAAATALAAEGAHVVLAADLADAGTPEEFGRVAAFVLSPAAADLTGAMIPVDGGITRAL